MVLHPVFLRLTNLLGDRGQVLQVLGWALTRIGNIPLVLHCLHKSGEEWLCAEQNHELFNDIRGRGVASNDCFHS